MGVKMNLEKNMYPRNSKVTQIVGGNWEYRGKGPVKAPPANAARFTTAKQKWQHENALKVGVEGDFYAKTNTNQKKPWEHIEITSHDKTNTAVCKVPECRLDRNDLRKWNLK